MDKDAVTVAALGMQAQSQRLTAPSYGISKVGRDAREKVFITEKHIRANRLGRESPVRNTINLPSTLNPLPRIRFSTASRPTKLPGEHMDDPDDIPTNDALNTHPDSQPFKYPREPEIIIGTDPRGKLKDAELLKNHAAAFYARSSPGPAAIGGEYGPDISATRPRMAPARKFGVKTKLKPDWTEINCQPAEVGPGLYPIRDFSIGAQHLSQRRNQNVHAFPHGPKFAKTVSADTISQLDAARSSLGTQPLGKNRSEPSIGMGPKPKPDDKRDKFALKMQVCRTKLDMGPAANMPKFHHPMPTYTPERAILASGFG